MKTKRRAKSGTLNPYLFEALTGSRPWTAEERARARRERKEELLIAGEIAERHGRTVIDVQLELGIGNPATLRLWRANRRVRAALAERAARA